MFEQAVYAGRNHALILAVGVALFAASPARAADVTHVRLGSTIDTLIAGPDGGAWVRVARAHGVSLGRAFPDGRFVTASSDALAGLGSALGPDGQAWFSAGLRTFARMDTAGRVTTVSLTGEPVSFEIATGPDGTLWAPVLADLKIAHITPQGAATYTPFQFPDCLQGPMPIVFARASDGAMWLADPICDRLARVSPAGAWSTIALPHVSTDALAADASGGMWFAGHESVGHVDAAGHVRRVALARGASAVAVTPDGSAWFARGTCRLARMTAAGPLSSVPVSIPATQVAADPAGGLWLASPARLQHVAAGAAAPACDDTPPALRITTRARVSVHALRARGLRIAVREPTAVRGTAFYTAGERHDVGRDLVKVTRRGTVRYRVAPSQLRGFTRALVAGRRVSIDFFATATDAEGNTADRHKTVHVTR